MQEFEKAVNDLEKDKIEHQIYDVLIYEFIT